MRAGRGGLEMIYDRDVFLYMFRGPVYTANIGAAVYLGLRLRLVRLRHMWPQMHRRSCSPTFTPDSESELLLLMPPLTSRSAVSTCRTGKMEHNPHLGPQRCSRGRGEGGGVGGEHRLS